MKDAKHAENGDANNSDMAEYLGRIAELLETSIRLQLAPVLDRELADPKMRALYDATGTMSATQLAADLKMSATTICAAWKHWADVGLMVKDGKSYRKVV